MSDLAFDIQYLSNKVAAARNAAAKYRSSDKWQADFFDETADIAEVKMHALIAKRDGLYDSYESWQKADWIRVHIIGVKPTGYKSQADILNQKKFEKQARKLHKKVVARSNQYEIWCADILDGIAAQLGFTFQEEQ